ncbi:hypothetical protein ASG93_21055 [Paenibacillus sp. Soil787]|nr:hypothetical protein ASG93_21055 [Paenibacillus sp. Soil787]
MVKFPILEPIESVSIQKLGIGVMILLFFRGSLAIRHFDGKTLKRGIENRLGIYKRRKEKNGK